MPNKNGVITTKQLRQIYNCRTPVIFSSANNSEKELLIFKNAGGNDFLSKPLLKHSIFYDVIIKHLKLIF